MTMRMSMAFWLAVMLGLRRLSVLGVLDRMMLTRPGMLGSVMLAGMGRTLMI